MPLRDFVLATLIGVVPTVVLYASLGASIDVLFADRRAASLFLEPGLLLPLLGLTALSATPTFWALWRRRTR